MIGVKQRLELLQTVSGDNISSTLHEVMLMSLTQNFMRGDVYDHWKTEMLKYGIGITAKSHERVAVDDCVIRVSRDNFRGSRVEAYEACKSLVKHCHKYLDKEEVSTKFAFLRQTTVSGWHISDVQVGTVLHSGQHWNNYTNQKDLICYNRIQRYQSPDNYDSPAKDEDAYLYDVRETTDELFRVFVVKGVLFPYDLIGTIELPVNFLCTAPDGRKVVVTVHLCVCRVSFPCNPCTSMTMKTRDATFLTYDCRQLFRSSLLSEENHMKAIVYYILHVLLTVKQKTLGELLARLDACTPFVTHPALCPDMEAMLERTFYVLNESSQSKSQWMRYSTQKYMRPGNAFKANIQEVFRLTLDALIVSYCMSFYPETHVTSISPLSIEG